MIRTSSLIGIVAATLVLLLPTEATLARAAEVKALRAVVMRAAVDDLIGDFERGTGHKVTVDYATAGVIRDRIQTGEVVDLTILPRPAMNQLVTQGKVTSGTIGVVARSEVAVGVRAGTPKPDISTPDVLKRSLLAAKSIAYADPTKSGIHFARGLERLGIVEEMKPKTKLSAGAEAAEMLARNEVEMAVLQKMEMLRVGGIDIVGPLPGDLRNTTDFVYVAGVAASARQPEAAKAFIAHLLAPDAARVIRAKGMDPGAE
jgi:molybdate transport system substrate-binding protein